METFHEKVNDMVNEILTKREELKEQFIKTWLTHLPDDCLNLEWLMTNVELVEVFDRDENKYRWFLQMKPDPKKFDDPEYQTCAQCGGKGYIKEVQLKLEDYHGS